MKHVVFLCLQRRLRRGVRQAVDEGDGDALRGPGAQLHRPLPIRLGAPGLQRAARHGLDLKEMAQGLCGGAAGGEYRQGSWERQPFNDR